MRQIVISSEGIDDRYTQSHEESLQAIGDIRREHFSEYLKSGKITSDMDGVMIFDDNAMTLTELVGGKKAKEHYSRYADLNIKAAEDEGVPYCWYAPTLFDSQLLAGLSTEVNRAVGKNMRLIPGAEVFYDNLRKCGYDVTTLTAGHQEGAEEVSKRLGIEKTIGTQIKVVDGRYVSQIERFIGGHCKEREAAKILNKDGIPYGVHIGDSWSDVETLKAFPSIAFNPGCQFALNNATVSVISSSINSLSPFFNPDRRDVETPEVVILNPQKLQVPEDILDLSKNTMKKQVLGTLVELANGESRVETIRNELRAAGIGFESLRGNLMSLEEFDEHAKEEWGRYREKHGI